MWLAPLLDSSFSWHLPTLCDSPPFLFSPNSFFFVCSPLFFYKVGESACFWDIWDSEIFSSKFFGAKSTTGGGEIADGRWANIQVPELNDAFFEEAMLRG